ncbi:MAG: tryptophan--tRNA ligase [Anaerolineales bacterium]|nr:tryptophan--tRNA ligase [Anaerolineales bacterium]
MDTKRILTGHRPTGPRHIGHLVGTLENWARLQDEYESFFLIADMHVLTTAYDQPDRIQDNIVDVLADWLAAGIDPRKSTLVLQSALMEHAQLSLLFSMMTTVARLERVPTYKDQIQQLDLNPSLGLLTYPVLQASDILIYKATAVPVGEDQMPHIELTREVARRFNSTYGDTFAEPEGLLISGEAARLPGIDNRTMHSSRGNTILLKDSPEETTAKIMQMYTDPKRIHATDPGTVEGNPVFIYHDVFNPDQDEVADFKKRYAAGTVGDVEVKRRLAEMLNAYLAPLRARRAELVQYPEELMAILYAGTEKARPVAQETLKEVQEKMGLHNRYFYDKEAVVKHIRKISEQNTFESLGLIP